MSVEGAQHTARSLVEAALHLRTHGEHAAGGRETWRDWERAAEAYLRDAVDAPGGES